jgi:hypothetical protein
LAPKSRQERLFGAACLKQQLERSPGVNASASEIYRGTLRDLDLEESEVEAYLREHQAEVEAALDARGGLKH